MNILCWWMNSPLQSTATSPNDRDYVEWRKEYMKTMDTTGMKELAEDLSLKIPYSVLS